MRGGNRLEPILFWSSIILGHVFLGMVLKESLSKRSLPREEPENINLLDDVLN